MNRRLHRSSEVAIRRGALATELALVLPFFVFAILVTIDFCRLYMITQTLTASANVGAYHASGAGLPPAYQPPTGGLLPIVTETVRPILGGDPVTGSPSPSDVRAAARNAAIAESASLQPALRGDQVAIRYEANRAVVTVTYTTDLITPIFGGARTVNLSRTVTMQVVNVVP